MKKVYIPQEPTRWDNTVEMHMPTMDFTPASRYGELVVCLPPNISFHMTKPVYLALKEKMREFSDDDYLIAVGSPLVIALSSHIALQRTGGKLNLLTWDRLQRQYLNHRVEL